MLKFFALLFASIVVWPQPSHAECVACKRPAFGSAVQFQAGQPVRNAVRLPVKVGAAAVKGTAVVARGVVRASAATVRGALRVATAPVRLAACGVHSFRHRPHLIARWRFRPCCR